MGRTVCFHGPDFHLTQSLAAELGLAAKGLLGDQRVGTDGSGVNLIIDQMVEFEHVHGADGNLFLERLSGMPVIEGRLPGGTQISLNQQFFDFLLFGTVEYRRSHMNTVSIKGGQADNVLVAHFFSGRRQLH